MQRGERRPRVLVAVSERAAERMGRVLQGFASEWCGSVEELRHALQRSQYDLVVVGSRFDGSNAIEAVKAVVQERAAPLACVRAAPFGVPLGDATLAAFRVAAEELGARCFVDVLQFPDDAAGNAELRAMLERCLD